MNLYSTTCSVPKLISESIPNAPMQSTRALTRACCKCLSRRFIFMSVSDSVLFMWRTYIINCADNEQNMLQGSTLGQNKCHGILFLVSLFLSFRHLFKNPQNLQ
jgi:hypothetical protein